MSTLKHSKENKTKHLPDWEWCVLTMPMHFFRILQMLTSFLENMGAGRDVLCESKRGVNTERISCITWSSSINIWKITTSLVVSAVQFKAGKHCGFMLDDLASSTLQTAFLLKCGTELNSKTFTFWVKRTLKTHKSVSCGYEAALLKSFRADNLARPTIWEKGLSDTCKLPAGPFNLMQYPWMHVQLCACARWL